MGGIRTISLDSWIHVKGSGVRNNSAFGSYYLPLHEGFTGQLSHPGLRSSPCSVNICIIKSPFAEVKRYIESNKYRASGCWCSATTCWAHNFRTVAGRLNDRPVKQVICCDLIVENGCLQNRGRCESQQGVECSCSVTSAKFVLSGDINNHWGYQRASSVQYFLMCRNAWSEFGCGLSILFNLYVAIGFPTRNVRGSARVVVGILASLTSWGASLYSRLACMYAKFSGGESDCEFSGLGV